MTGGRWLRYFAAGALALSLSAATVRAVQKDGAKGVHWPSFRGVNASGIAEGFPTATEWNVETNRNVRWKTPIPGLAHSSPIVWGDRLFVATAISSKEKPELKIGLYGSGDPADDSTLHEWKVYCLDKKTGKILWERTAHKGVPRLKRHTKATQANSTMATDGRNLVAFFGSEGVFCYDMQGGLRWKKDLGKLHSGPYNAPDLEWGFASSPILYKDRVLIQCDVLKGGFIAALDLKDGAERWRTTRRDVATWSTPTLVEVEGRTQLIVNGWKHIGGYDIETGKETWWMEGGGDIPVPTPVVADGLIYINNAHGRMSPIYAVKATAKGDISLTSDQTANDHIAWSEPRNGAYMQTPLVYGDLVYSCRDNGVINCYEAKTGQVVYKERLGTGRTGFSASPVAADGKVYFTSEEGDIFVVKAGREFKVVSQNPMGEICMATPAISEGVLFFRTQGHVIAVANMK
jgi:outer membrane protein assembly factor BamB